MDIFKSIKISMVLSSLVVLFVCIFSNIGFADPSIMLYVDGGSDYYYDNTKPIPTDPTIINYSVDLGFSLIPTSPDEWNTDTFVTNSSAFRFVIATDKYDWFYDMHLVAAVLEGETGSLNVSWGSTVLSGTMFNGTPTITGYGKTYVMPTHSVFPTDYLLYSLGDIENDVNEPIFLDITFSGYSRVHFDAFAYNGKKWDDNPFSHDVTSTGEPIPEPGTLILFGTGIIGMIGSFARKRFKELKRFLDVVFSGIGLVLLSPLFLFVGILIKLDSKGSVFYKQVRVGENQRKSREKIEKGQEERRRINAPGRLFMVHKFRTMKLNAETKTGPVWAKEDDTRVTKIGHFLRKSHLDELPQLFNVLIGEMSLIGPRPERPIFVDNFNRVIPKYKRRLKVKPGITGLAQVRHGYDETIDDVKTKVKYDLLYIDHLSWFGEARVMFWTARRMLTGKGAR